MSSKTRRKGQVFRRLTIGALLAPVLGIAACSDEQPVMPADAPGISRSEEYSFGLATQAQDWRAARTVLDQLEAQFGQKSMRILARNLDSAADPQILKAHYAERLAGWTEMPLNILPSGHGLLRSSVRMEIGFWPWRHSKPRKVPGESCRSISSPISTTTKA